MKSVRYLHSSAVQVLADSAQEHPERYEAGDPPQWEDVCDRRLLRWHIDSGAELLPSPEELSTSLVNSTFDNQSDGQDSLSLYGALNTLKPQQAADGRLWVGLTHFELYGYVRKRWDAPQLDPSGEKGAKLRYIRSHWFVSGNRGLIRDNAVSRLWWMGRILTLIAKRVDLAPPVVADTLFERADIRAQLFERPSTGSNIPLAAEITLALREDRSLRERNAFRRWMIRLNQLGGAILLDALRPDDLRRVVREEAAAALA